MFWDEELDFSLRSKISAKKGRRSKKEESNVSLQEDDDVVPQTRKPGRWADEALKGRKNKNFNLLEQQRFSEQTKEDIYNNIPEIPDSDDFTESIPDQTATAPTVTVNRTETYSQINKDLMKSSLLSTMGDTDFSVLTETLSSEEQLKEMMRPKHRTLESLFAELSEDYYKRKMKK